MSDQPQKAPPRVVMKRTGLEEADGSGRLVEVVATSYLHGAVHEPGAVVAWPAGVEKLGANLKPYGNK